MRAASLSAFLALVLALPLLLSARPPAAAEPLTVERITPAGEDVAAGRQLVIRFDRPMVTLGRTERSAGQLPVRIEPALSCQWRWLDTRTVACQLDEAGAMRPATRYRVSVGPGFAALDGATLAAPVEHVFLTERPRLEWLGLERWQGPGVPVLRAQFNLPVTAGSVESALHLETAQGTTPLRVAEVAEAPRPGWLLLPLPGEEGRSLLLRPREADDQPGDARRYWLLAPERALPEDASVTVRLRPGLSTPSGPEPGAENRQALRFDTFPAFRFLGLRCWSNEGREIDPGDGGRCNPMRPVELTFSAPVIPDEVREHVRFTPDLAGGRRDYDPWASAPRYSRLYGPHRRGDRYGVALPELLRAAETYQASVSAELRDEFGRPLPAPFPIRFATDHRPPELVLLHRAAVLEQAVETELPLAVTNLDSLDVHYQGQTAEAFLPPAQRRLDLPAVEDVSFLLPLGVRELLGGRSGALWGYLEPTPEVARHRREREFFAQVTPFQVHVKLGHFNGLAWVTDLATGEPVAGARVSVLPRRYADLVEPGTPLAEALTDSSGLARLPGAEELDPERRYAEAWDRDAERLFVKVIRGGDMALLPLDFDFGLATGRVSGWEVWSEGRPRNGHVIAWGTTAQGIYRAGETVQYKLYLRGRSARSLVPPPPGPYVLTVYDPMDRPVHRREQIRASEFGAVSGELPLPETAAVGYYRFELEAEFMPAPLAALRVLVSDFTPSPFRVLVEAAGERFQPGDTLRLATRARMHAGGPYANAEARVNVRLRPEQLRPADPRLRNFHFQTLEPERRELVTLFQQEGRVDAAGELSSELRLPEAPVLYGELLIESAVADDRGRSVAGFDRARYYGRDRYVGLRSGAWLLTEDEPARVELAVIDPAGEPLAGVPVELRVEREVVTAARVKGAGNAYLTQYRRDWEAAGGCRVVSAASPVACEFTPAEPGRYRLTAEIRDGRGRVHRSELDQWVQGKGRVLWSTREENALEILPERAGFRVGETARYLVKNPYPGARALVSVERYGVIDSWVQTLEASTAVIEFPVRPDYLPGYYLSVVLVSPRVEAPQDPLQVDLGKPALRMGYVRSEVRDPYKEIEVGIELEREVYRPGETVRLALTAAPRHGGGEAPVELAVAVLDEAVFDLLSEGRAYFDPYAGLFRLDSLDLENYNLLLRLVGRQNFEKKGADPGGDGGGAQLDVRGDFRYVAYWNPELRLANGRAELEFEAPDNLTGWKVLALAATPGDRLGLGEAGFTVNRPTELRPAMPNQVLEGDSFVAGVSLTNRTDRPRRLTVSWRLEGEARPAGGAKLEQAVSLAPYERVNLELPVQALSAGEICFAVRAQDELDGDGLAHAVPVRRRLALETVAAYGSGDGPERRELVSFPEDMREDVGSLALVVSTSVIGSLDGAFRYLRDYPYGGWEAKLSRAVAAAQYLALREHLPAELEWPQAEPLVQGLAASAAAFQAPGGGMAYFAPDEAYVDPYLSAYTALAFGWLRDGGHAVPEEVERRLHGYLERLLRQNVLPDFYSAGMASSVRAVALAALAGRGRLPASELERYRHHLPWMDLFGRAHFLMAALRVPGAEAARDEALARILAQAVESGGKLAFNEPWDDGYSRILATPLRANCAVLSALVAAQEAGVGAGLPVKLARTVTASRGRRDHWENTQENLFCLDALSRYARVFEAESPAFTLSARLGAEALGEASFHGRQAAAERLERPLRAGDAGREAELVLSRQGSGRYHYGLYLEYAPARPDPRAVNAGMELRREYSVRRGEAWQRLTGPIQVARGELLRVDLYLSLPTARNFVVVEDPVPGGLEPVERRLATASVVDADTGDFQLDGGSWYFHYDDWHYYGESRWSFHHQALRHDAARFYADYLPPGNYHLSYTAQAIAPGRFTAPPARAQEMYDPDVFGRGEAAELRVGE